MLSRCNLGGDAVSGLGRPTSNALVWIGDASRVILGTGGHSIVVSLL